MEVQATILASPTLPDGGVFQWVPTRAALEANSAFRGQEWPRALLQCLQPSLGMPRELPPAPRRAMPAMLEASGLAALADALVYRALDAALEQLRGEARAAAVLRAAAAAAAAAARPPSLPTMENRKPLLSQGQDTAPTPASVVHHQTAPEPTARDEPAWVARALQRQQSRRLDVLLRRTSQPLPEEHVPLWVTLAQQKASARSSVS